MALSVYYAHCIALYGTPQEQRDVATLRQMGFDVINPNNPVTVEACEDARFAGADTQAIMNEIFKPMVKGAHVLAFRALPDEAIPAGVAKEIEWALEEGKPVIELPSAIKRRVLTVEQTREYLKDVGAR